MRISDWSSDVCSSDLNGAWNRSLPNVAVFDDIFIDENVYSGLSVDTEHRQRLHELILGVRGVALNDELRRELVRIEEHNAELRVRGAAIPAEARGTLASDAFSQTGRTSCRERVCQYV